MLVLLWYFIAACTFVIVIAGWLIIRSSLLRLEINDVTKRHVFITGCDTGFGNLLARTLDQRGLYVFAGCFTTKGAKELTACTSSRLRTVSIDIADTQSVREAFTVVEAALPPGQGLWGLVNNAGILPNFSPMECMTKDDFESVCQVNTFGTIDVTLTFLPLVHRAQGRIVTVCSIMSNYNACLPSASNYYISKAALKMFIVCLRRELYGSGVTCHGIEPGGFLTNIVDQDRLMKLWKGALERLDPAKQDFYGGYITSRWSIGLKYVKYVISSKPQKVADTMAHALLSRYPKREYIVGFDARFIYRPLMMMPGWLVDFLVGWRPYGPRAKELQ